jgi:hypothetical protein
VHERDEGARATLENEGLWASPCAYLPLWTEKRDVHFKKRAVKIKERSVEFLETPVWFHERAVSKKERTVWFSERALSNM